MSTELISNNFTKNKLIHAAVELLKEHGFNGICVEDITKKAGVAKGTFYTYFKRKEDIIFEISKAPFCEVALELNDMEEIPIIEKLSFYFYRFIECVEFCGINACREWIRNVIDPNSVNHNTDDKKFEYDFKTICGILEGAVNEGELNQELPIELLAHIIISELYGMMVCFCMSDGKFEPLEQAEKFCKFQLEKLLEKYII